MSENEINFAYIISCGDPKIRAELTRFFDNRFGKEKYFWMPEFGGVKDLLYPNEEGDRKHILRKIQIAQKVHPFGLVILINHSACGAYALDGETFDDPKTGEAFHAEELKQAEVRIKDAFPKIAVEHNYFLKAEQRLAW